MRASCFLSPQKVNGTAFHSIVSKPKLTAARSAPACRDIRQAWATAGQRYRASREAIALAQGPLYSIWDDFPDEPGQV